jgi:hypothetical protein
MTATVAGIHLGPDTHANRPAAGTPPVGSLYSCTTHSLVYRTDGSTWSTWATLGGAAVTDATISTSDITTNDVSSSKHGWAPKGDGTTTKFLNANGAYSTPASGGMTHTYYGKNAVGASLQALTDKVWCIKKITLASAGYLGSISAYIKDSASGGVVSFGVGLWADNSNDVGLQIGGMTSPTLSLLPEGPASTSSQRWYHRPVDAYLTAGDYWIGVAQLDHSGGEAISLAYDTGGSDKTITSGGLWIPDGGFYSRTTTTRDHSIRASVLS